MKSRKTKNSDRLIILTIILSPLLLYFYLVFPIQKEITIFSYIFRVDYHEDIQVLVWYIFLEANFTLLLCLWFFTSKQWWKYALIFNIAYAIFSLLSIVNDEIVFIENFDYNYFALIFIITLPILALFDKYYSYEPFTFSEKIEFSTGEKLSSLIEFDKNKYSSLKQEYENLKIKKCVLSNKEYLYKLMAIQTAIEDVKN